jgi:hypothetical protein
MYRQMSRLQNNYQLLKNLLIISSVQNMSGLTNFFFFSNMI